MGLFQKITDAKVNGGGVYFLPGAYLVEVVAVKTGKTREGNRDFFVAEFTILESNHTERKPGTSVSWMVMLDRYQETGLGNIKGFVAALFGIKPEEVDEAGVEALVGDDNPGKGIKIRASASNITTKGGKPFTKVQWTHVPLEG